MSFNHSAMISWHPWTTVKSTRVNHEIVGVSDKIGSACLFSYSIDLPISSWEGLFYPVFHPVEGDIRCAGSPAGVLPPATLR